MLAAVGASWREIMSKNMGGRSNPGHMGHGESTGASIGIITSSKCPACGKKPHINSPKCSRRKQEMHRRGEL